MKPKDEKFFQMRVDDEFLFDLERLVALHGNNITKAQMLRRLVKYAADEKLVLHEKVIKKPS